MNDQHAIALFTVQMAEKMAAKRRQGASGWQRIGAKRLSKMLREHVEKGDPVDVANFCMMLAVRGLKIE